LKFDLITLPSSVPFLKKSGYFNARRYPPLRRYGSRHAPPCLFREGNLIFLCEADTVTGEVREAILSEMTKREPRHYGALTGYYYFEPADSQAW